MPIQRDGRRLEDSARVPRLGSNLSFRDTGPIEAAHGSAPVPSGQAICSVWLFVSITSAVCILANPGVRAHTSRAHVFRVAREPTDNPHQSPTWRVRGIGQPHIARFGRPGAVSASGAVFRRDLGGPSRSAPARELLASFRNLAKMRDCLYTSAAGPYLMSGASGSKHADLHPANLPDPAH